MPQIAMHPDNTENAHLQRVPADTLPLKLWPVLNVTAQFCDVHPSILRVLSTWLPIKYTTAATNKWA